MNATMESLLSLKPVQTAVKGLAVGSAMVGVMWCIRLFTAPSTAEQLLAKCSTQFTDLTEIETMYLKGIAESDAELFAILERLLVFQKFERKLFLDILAKSFLATQTMFVIKHGETLKSKATTSFRIRKVCQAIIEAVRLFRNYLELSMQEALEDFDEIAKELNDRVEQTCTESVIDTFA